MLILLHKVPDICSDFTSCMQRMKKAAVCTNQVDCGELRSYGITLATD